MDNKYILCNEFIWTENYYCPYRLLFNDAGFWHITTRVLNDTILLGETSSPSPDPFWIDDGSEVCVLDHSGRVFRLTILESSANPPTASLVWESVDHKAISGCFVKKRFYIITRSQQNMRYSVWRLQTGRPSDCIIGDMPALPLMMANSRNSPILLQPNYPKDGLATITCLDSGGRKVHFLSEGKVYLASCGQSSRCFIFSAYESERLVMYSYDIEREASIPVYENPGMGSESPDAMYIAVIAEPGDKMIVVDLYSSISHCIVSLKRPCSGHFPYRYYSPNWSPDGNWLSVSLCPRIEERRYAPSSFIVNLRSRSVIKLPYFAQNLSWAPAV